MRILMVTDFYPPATGGVEHHVHSLSHALARRGHHVTVATLRRPGAPPEEWDGGVLVRRIPATTQRIQRLYSTDRLWAPPVPDPESVSGLRSIVKEARPEIVHGHDWLARSFLPLKRWSKAALIVSLHYYGLTCAKKSLLYRQHPCSGPAARKCLGCAANHYGYVKGPAVAAGSWIGGRAERALVDRFITVSEAVAIGNGLAHHRQPVDIIPNFVAEHDMPSKQPDDAFLRQLPEGDFVLFAGDLRHAKGLAVLLEAYSGLPDPPPLVLIGKTWPETPRAFPPGVLTLGEWPRSAVFAAWSRCLFGVVPSVWPEPFGIVLIEAMVCGKPVIASRIGGIPEVVVDGETGLLVPPGDSAALREAMFHLLAHPDLRARMGKAGLERSVAYCEASVVPRIERVYEAAIRARQ